MSAYARRMAFLSARIFGETVSGTSYRNQKVVNLWKAMPRDKFKDKVNYYPPYMKIDLAFQNLRFHGLYRDEHLDFVEENLRKRILRGKVKPNKGEGKRAMKRKVG